MSSADIQATLTTVRGEKEKFEKLLNKLQEAIIEKKCVIEERDTERMGGTKYQEQHETMKQLVSDFVKAVKSEKSEVKEALLTKIKQLEIDLNDLNIQYKNALADEEAKRRAALLKAARQEAEALKNHPLKSRRIR